MLVLVSLAKTRWIFKTMSKKINPQRLSRLIMSKEVKSNQDYMLELYGQLSENERTELKEMFKRNAKLDDSIKIK